MKSFFIFFLLFVVAHCKKCFLVEDTPKCPKGEVYQLKGPGPFCYPTCCGPRGPPCRMDSFTTGCFCADSNQVKMFPVANNTVADPNNPCVSTCDFTKCEASKCPKANEEWRDCGPTSMCDNQVCRGMRPMCTEEDAQICVAGCFCVAGFKRFGGECIKKCPLLP
ncbi:unnamed protein product [Chironomus riparius]|uniref:TIL domain-containing protein n=1 Tax=Chironomus riparius TaxID=315576 RepID=A0A9N9WLH8_9DIPT|nr:unnamed protein product [Chironomus riparius]